MRIQQRFWCNPLNPINDKGHANRQNTWEKIPWTAFASPPITNRGFFRRRYKRCSFRSGSAVGTVARRWVCSSTIANTMHATTTPFRPAQRGQKSSTSNHVQLTSNPPGRRISRYSPSPYVSHGGGCSTSNTSNEIGGVSALKYFSLFSFCLEADTRGNTLDVLDVTKQTPGIDCLRHSTLRSYVQFLREALDVIGRLKRMLSFQEVSRDV